MVRGARERYGFTDARFRSELQTGPRRPGNSRAAADSVQRTGDTILDAKLGKESGGRLSSRSFGKGRGDIISQVAAVDAARIGLVVNKEK